MTCYILYLSKTVKIKKKSVLLSQSEIVVWIIKGKTYQFEIRKKEKNLERRFILYYSLTNGYFEFTVILV